MCVHDCERGLGRGEGAGAREKERERVSMCVCVFDGSSAFCFQSSWSEPWACTYPFTQVCRWLMAENLVRV